MIVDTLTRKQVITYIFSLSEVVSDFNDIIKQIVGLDASYEKLRQ